METKQYKIERIVVDPEFSGLVQPLSADERAQLEANIRRDGVREPLSIWMADGTTPTLLDGHNRRAIALAMGLPEVPVHFIKLPDREAALLWVEENQAGRRNLTDRSEEHTSELQSLAYLVCRLLLEKKKKKKTNLLQHSRKTDY